MSYDPHQELIGAIILGGYDLLLSPLHIQVSRTVDGSLHLLASEQIEVIHARDMFFDLFERGKMIRAKSRVAALLEARDSKLERIRSHWERAKARGWEAAFIRLYALTPVREAKSDIWRGIVRIPKCEELRGENYNSNQKRREAMI